MATRILDWDGCKNVRDLVGLTTASGRLTCWKSIVRSDTPNRLTDAGWKALYDYGIRTIVSLQTHGLVEKELWVTPPFPEISVTQAAIEDFTDQEFVRKSVETNLWLTLLYLKDALQRWPARHAAAISAIAQAGPGGVLIHCARGNDRTGIIALLLLALTGVATSEIIADYQLSPDSERDGILHKMSTSTPAVLSDLLNGLEVENYLLNGGVSQAELLNLRNRLVS